MDGWICHLKSCPLKPNTMYRNYSKQLLSSIFKNMYKQNTVFSSSLNVF